MTEIPVKQALADALEARGYDTLTPVQQAVTKPETYGADLLVSAQTGSGKTLGFGLAIAPTILGEAEAFDAAGAPLALVIAPTRELAMQVMRELSWLYAKAGAVVTSCVGGMDMRDERRALGRGAHIVVATPGRLRDHIMRKSMDLSAIRAVVLDEADEMLDLGFRDDLEFILGESPEDRQTLMFSATVPPTITKLAKSYQRDAVRIVTKSETTQHADIEYMACAVSERDTENAIINSLRYYEAPNALVFCNTRAMVNRLTTRLSNRGFSVVALSGELSQSERTHALQAMRDGRARVCVATDVAARGIDLPNLDLVVHAELPGSHETMLHRSGRTGRAGRKGVSLLIVPPKARKKAERILGWAKVKAEWGSAPSADAVRERDQERMLADPVWLEPVQETHQETVAQLAATFTPEQLANAYWCLYHSHYSAPEELAGADEPAKPRVAFGPSVWFSIPGGANAGAEPRRLLPMLCTIGDLSKEDIGAIRVRDDVSYVEILETSVDGFLKAVGPELKDENGAQMTRLATPPDLSGGAPRGKSFGDKPKFKSGSKPDHKSGPRPDSKYGPKPERNAGPKPDYKPAPKSNERADAKPRWKKPDDAAAPARPAAAPIDWNDAPAERVKKPKPPKTAGSPKARHKFKNKTNKGVEDGAVRAGGPKRGPKGPPPPVGRPDSKKNIARAAAAGKGGKPPRKPSEGGSGKPRRGKPSGA